jgi:hypothetical protein
VVGSARRYYDDSFADAVVRFEVLVGCSDLVESGVRAGDDDAHGSGFDGVEVVVQRVGGEVGGFSCVAGEMDAIGDRERRESGPDSPFRL